MFAISVRYMPQTKTRLARFKVSGGFSERTFPFDQKLSLDDNVKQVVRVFASLECWPGVWAIGQLPDRSWVAACARREIDTVEVGATYTRPHNETEGNSDGKQD